MAKVLAGGFVKHGHEVMMGTRAPDKLADWARQNPKVRIGTFADAAEFAELAVLAVKYGGGRGTACSQRAHAGRQGCHRCDQPDCGSAAQ